MSERHPPTLDDVPTAAAPRDGAAARFAAQAPQRSTFDPAPAPDGVAEAATRLQRLAARRGARLARRRRRHGSRMTALAALAALLALVPLVSILVFLFARGAQALGPALVAESARFPDAGRPFVNAVVGSLLTVTIAALLGLPVGLGAGLYLAERRGTRRAAVVRYLADVLLGVPSIVFGIVAWLLVVRPSGHFSAWAGGVALGAMVVPLVARTTDDLLALVPASLAEAALALGYPRWRTALDIVLRSALPGVVTGALVAMTRVAGETAPLLFTAFGNQYFSADATQPVAALPLQIYTGALGASERGRQQAYAAALVLLAAIALFSTLARRASRRAAGVGAAPGRAGTAEMRTARVIAPLPPGPVERP